MVVRALSRGLNKKNSLSAAEAAPCAHIYTEKTHKYTTVNTETGYERDDACSVRPHHAPT